MAKKTRIEARKRRHTRVRRKLRGTPERPRLNVYRSMSNIYAQVIDDVTGRTLAQASTVDPEVRRLSADKSKVEQASVVGRQVAERARAVGVRTVVFDRGGYKYHGRVRALAEAARESGLEF